MHPNDVSTFWWLKKGNIFSNPYWPKPRNDSPDLLVKTQRTFQRGSILVQTEIQILCFIPHIVQSEAHLYLHGSKRLTAGIFKNSYNPVFIYCLFGCFLRLDVITGVLISGVTENKSNSTLSFSAPRFSEHRCRSSHCLCLLVVINALKMLPGLGILPSFREKMFSITVKKQKTTKKPFCICFGKLFDLLCVYKKILTCV